MIKKTMINVTREESNFDPFWTNLIQSDQNILTICILMMNVTTLHGNICWLERFTIWSSLIQFGQFWSNLIKNRMIIFFVMVNVTTFCSNIFWLVRTPIWSSLIHFVPFWTDLIKYDQKKNYNFYYKGHVDW